jgi:hypothetical protein
MSLYLSKNFKKRKKELYQEKKTKLTKTKIKMNKMNNKCKQTILQKSINISLVLTFYNKKLFYQKFMELM